MEPPAAPRARPRSSPVLPGLPRSPRSGRRHSRSRSVPAYGTPRPRRCPRNTASPPPVGLRHALLPALDHDVGLALLHDLAPLVRDRPLENDDAAVRLGGLPLVDHLDTHLDRVPDLDRPLEAPAQADERH